MVALRAVARKSLRVAMHAADANLVKPRILSEQKTNRAVQPNIPRYEGYEVAARLFVTRHPYGRNTDSSCPQASS